MDDAHYDFEIDAYCPVCDRALPAVPVSGAAPLPPPLPAAGAAAAAADSSQPVASTSTAPPPSSSQRSRASDTSAASSHAPRMKRSGSSASAASSSAAAASGPSAGSSKGAALKRNKSSARVHHHHHHGAGGRHGGAAIHGYGHHRSHSHANLTALAPMTGVESSKGAAKKGAIERRPSKAREEILEVIEVKDDDGGAPSAAGLGMYCSEECRRIDEMRNQLTLAHLGATPAPASASAPAPSSSAGSSDPAISLSHADSFSSSLNGRPFDAMSRRRSSGLSSNGSSSFAPSRSNLSPIWSAAPTANPGQFDETTPAFPFPPQTSTPHPPAARSASSHSLPQAVEQPPFLNFGARRSSRSGGVTGGYSYRPSLMERVSSSEGGAASDSGGVWLGVERGFSRPGSRAAESHVRPGRSMSTGSGPGARLGRSDRTQSVDALAGMSDPTTGFPSARPPSALASLRSMTPISDRIVESPDSVSPARAAYQPKLSPRAESPRSHSAQPELATSPLARSSFMVGSAPARSAMRRRGPSFGEPTLPEGETTATPARPISAASGLQRSQRSSSSASLALMGSSLGRSYEPRAWGGPTRSESTAGLSALVAQGEMTSASPSPALPPVSASSTSTVIPTSSSRSSSRRHHSPLPPSASSPSSASSYAPSQSSVFSQRSSTAGSSDHHLLSSSAGSSHKRTASRGRSLPGLVMTPSGTNLAGADTTPTPASLARGASTTRLPANALVANAASTNPALAHLKLQPDEPAPPPPPNRSFSWQQIPGVPTYAAYDVDSFRAREKEGDMGPPPAPKDRKERKKLFHFADD
ncbi:uncharacterized protein JCM10292_001302 [Rhodotorula paludigena]|uniref:uncharacterized protein n=1 Tax=Rhodotorula paludigena TaxID=86838 RepID=UPI00317BA550